jgi:hypothetical protein
MTSPSPRARIIRRILLGVAATVVLVAVGGGGYWALTCPCDGTPGFILRGEVNEAPVTDWSFANDVTLCQVQISVGWRPHSVNLNCMATPNGDLFLSCSFGARKYWCPKVGPNEPARLRLDGVVYPVVLNRVTDPATLDAAWAARVGKLQDPEVQAVQPPGTVSAPDAVRQDSWWSFQVRSATAG